MKEECRKWTSFMAKPVKGVVQPEVKSGGDQVKVGFAEGEAAKTSTSVNSWRFPSGNSGDPTLTDDMSTTSGLDY